MMYPELLYILILDFQVFTLFYKKIFLIIEIFFVFFFNCRSINFLMNIYSDSSQTALKYLKNTKANINNVLIIFKYLSV